MKYYFFLLGAALAWGQQPTQPPPTQPPPTLLPVPSAGADPVVLTVGPEKITKSQFEQILASLPDNQRKQFESPDGKRRLADQIAEIKAMAQQARADKLDQSSAVKTRLALQADQFLAQNEFEQLMDHANPDDAALHAYYDQHKQDWEEVKARHILIRTKGSPVPARPNTKELTDDEALAKAKELRAKIVAGTPFADVAKTDSDDTGTAPEGGDLGTFARGRMIPEFENAVFAQEVGKVSEPVKTKFGYHLILVDQRTTKTFDEVRPDIEKKLKPEIAQKGVDGIRSKAGVELNPDYFGK